MAAGAGEAPLSPVVRCGSSIANPCVGGSVFPVGCCWLCGGVAAVLLAVVELAAKVDRDDGARAGDLFGEAAAGRRRAGC